MKISLNSPILRESSFLETQETLFSNGCIPQEQHPPSMAVHTTRSEIPTIFDLFAADPAPLPILLLVTTASILLLAPWLFSFEFDLESAKGSTHLALLAVSITLVMVVRWLSSTGVSLSTPRSDGCCRSFSGCFSEGFLPFLVASLIVLLFVMGQFQNQIHGNWLFGAFG